MDEKRKAIPESFHAQISTFTKMMNKRIQDNSARTDPTEGPRDRRPPSEAPFTDEPGTSRTLPLASLVTLGYSLNIDTHYFLGKNRTTFCENIFGKKRNASKHLK